MNWFEKQFNDWCIQHAGMNLLQWNATKDRPTHLQEQYSEFVKNICNSPYGLYLMGKPSPIWERLCGR